jgi:hypothetical protein
MPEQKKIKLSRKRDAADHPVHESHRLPQSISDQKARGLESDRLRFLRAAVPTGAR